MKFNLSQFKKVSEDKDTAVMQHPEGHHIVIAKSILSPKAMAELKKLPLHSAEGSVIPMGDEAQDEAAAVAEAEGYPVQKAQPGIAGDLEPNPTPTGSDEGVPLDTPAQNVDPALAGATTNALTNYTLPNLPDQAQGMAMQAQAKMPQMDSAPIAKNYKEQVAGVYQQANAQAAEGNAKAGYASRVASSLEDLNARSKMLTDTYIREGDEFMKDMAAGHINPNHYQESMSTGKKVSTAIGLILGGISGGLLKTSNPAMDFLNKQIERDIASQQANQDNKKTLFNANLARFKNVQDATDMTRANLMQILAVQFQQAGSASQGQLARGVAMEKAGALKNQAAMLMQTIAERNAVAGQGPGSMMGSKLAGNAVTIPGMGTAMAMTPKDAETAKVAIQGYNKLNSHIKKMDDFMANTGTTLPGTTKNARAKAMKTILSMGLKELFSLGALSKDDYATLDAMVPDPGQIMTKNGRAILSEMKQFLRSSVNSTLETRLPGAQLPADAPQNNNVMGGYKNAGRS